MSATLKCFEGTKIDKISCCAGRFTAENSDGEEEEVGGEVDIDVRVTTFNTAACDTDSSPSHSKHSRSVKKPHRKKPRVFVDEAADIIILSSFHQKMDTLVSGVGEMIVLDTNGCVQSVSGGYLESMGVKVGQQIKDGKKKLDNFVGQLHEQGIKSESRSVMTITSMTPMLWSVYPIIGAASKVLGTVIVLQSPPAPDLSQMDDG